MYGINIVNVPKLNVTFSVSCSTAAMLYTLAFLTTNTNNKHDLYTKAHEIIYFTVLKFVFFTLFKIGLTLNMSYNLYKSRPNYLLYLLCY